METNTGEKTKPQLNKYILISIVYVALLLDHMLMTTIIPIIPAILQDFRQESPIDNLNIINSSNLTSDFIQKDNYLLSDGQLIGILIGSKPLVQLVANLFVGPIIHKIGYTIPMFFGFNVVIVSTLIFAFGQNFTTLLIARSIQGIGSACGSTAGMGILAKTFNDPKKRTFAISFALGGIALGILAGFPFGGFLYHYTGGKEVPFLILTFVGILEAIMQLIFLKPKLEKVECQGTAMWKLLLDPYIAIAVFGLMINTINISTLEPTLPLWMIETMQSKTSTIGVIFVPVTFAFMIAVHFSGFISLKLGRWLVAMLGIWISGLGLCTVPLARHVYQLIIPNALVGFGLGTCNSALLPEMAHLVDLRHSGLYGNVYAISDIALCLSFVIGSVLSSVLYTEIGFTTTMWLFGGLSILSSLLLIFLRNPSTKKT